ncbi:glutamate receptor 2.8-like isoform X2 [Amaranthus tricolor]|uniref:glutamate receptor 2.8-like isoform X2 n=1 Tax=Amaranthus tricolor TaxID=29722 RepID=UPI0025897936|nr:glutamate receptor 2.8-like isoform X2 [Amaranthus tricolor]
MLMHCVFYILFTILVILPSTNGSVSLRNNCSKNINNGSSVGVLINQNTRVGKELKIAMKIAVRDIYRNSCNLITLHFPASSESFMQTISSASKLKVEILIATISLTEAEILSETHNFSGTPIILLNPTTMPPPLGPLSSKLIQFSHNFSIHMNCLSAIIGHFQWRRVTLIYQKPNQFPIDSAFFTVLSDSLRSVNTIIEQYIEFPPKLSQNTIEQNLKILKNGSNRVFVLLHSSLELTTRLFKMANRMDMVRKGFIWVISDEIVTMLDFIDPSIIASMQGVIGYKTMFNDTSQLYKDFDIKFKRGYFSKYPKDLGHYPSPSMFGLRAYDLIHAIKKAKNKSSKVNELFPNLLLSDFNGLSGNVRFEKGELKQKPIFKIINVVGKSYKELVFWSPELGFFGEVGPIYWPGGVQEVPRGWELVSSMNTKKLRIAVPASGAFHLVNVSVVGPNKTSINGFVIDVFNTSLKYLPYDLPFKLVPFYGRYDDMVHRIQMKEFDAAVGDILILEERYKWADFSQPFVKSGMNMVVTVKEDTKKEMWIFTTVFEKKLWVYIASMGIFIGFVVWLVEHRHNPDFAAASTSQQLGKVFWFSFTLLFFVQTKYCRGYAIAGPTYNFGGFGFAFEKGSELGADMSAAILKATERGEIETLQKNMFTQCKCSSPNINNNGSTSTIGSKPFSGLFFICCGVAVVALIVTVLPLVEQHWKILSVVKEATLRSRNFAWISLMILFRNRARFKLPILTDR